MTTTHASRGQTTKKRANPSSIIHECRHLPIKSKVALTKTDYQLILESRNPRLLDEKDWPGKGQRVECSKDEQITPEEISHFGSSLYMTVEKVRCRQIVVARQRIPCTCDWMSSDAFAEVDHLH
jgi:hypothetical protein